MYDDSERTRQEAGIRSELGALKRMDLSYTQSGFARVVLQLQKIKAIANNQSIYTTSWAESNGAELIGDQSSLTARFEEEK